MENITSTQEILKQKHTLLEWMVILREHPEIRDEFEKLCPPPKPIE